MKIPLMNNPLKDPSCAQNMYRVIDKILDHWKMDDQEKALMFGAEEDAYRTIKSQKEIPATEEMLLRASDMIAIFRMLSTMYHYDYETIGRRWIKRKNWRAPFYGDRPLEHITKGYLALLEVRRHLEKLFKSYGGAAVGKASVVVGDAVMGEIISFDNFALLQNEDADILAIMILRVCRSLKLTLEEVTEIAQSNLSELHEVALGRSFPEEKSLVVWRTILMIYYALLILHHGKEDDIYKWMSILNIGLKNGMTPLGALRNGDHYLLYRLLKPHVFHMP